LNHIDATGYGGGNPVDQVFWVAQHPVGDQT
jgi:hypothetical protein